MVVPDATRTWQHAKIRKIRVSDHSQPATSEKRVSVLPWFGDALIVIGARETPSKYRQIGPQAGIRR